jgi:DNA (cytosine-5)-methyltransferase 1
VTIKKRDMGVKQVRGPFVRLAPHPQSCADEQELGVWVADLRSRDQGQLLVADLFAGAGGLSLGLEQAGLRVVLSVDHDAEAVETHRHHFPGLTVDWDLGDPATIERVARIIQDCGIDVLAGGPPCQPFSKAGRSKIRDRVRSGLRDPYDQRRDLWRSYLEIIRISRPQCVIMENVPDMVLDREMFILRSIVLELETLGYSVEERVVETRKYGVPQFRQRLILVAVQGAHHFQWPVENDRPVTVWQAIRDLPEVQGGWRPDGGPEGWQGYDGPRTPFQRLMREGVPDDQKDRIYDHITRPVREDDARAFALMDPETRYSDLPEEFKRYRDDIFDDKYKRLDGDNWSRTITAHIAKDGYWYIHPTQHRTITIREAARLQTFPDWYRFAGPPSAAFRQIGNAVPPRLGRVIGENLTHALGVSTVTHTHSETVSLALSTWFAAQPELRIPWFRAETRWQVLSAEILLDRASPQHVRSLWPLLARWTSPSQTLEAADELCMIAGWINRQPRAEEVLAIATRVVENGHAELHDEALSALVAAKMVAPSQADMVTLVLAAAGQDSSEEPVIINKGVLRVAANYTGEVVDARNRLTDGRVAVARMIGYGPGARDAHLALMELSNSLCRPVDPDCAPCPLSRWCKYALTTSGLVLRVADPADDEVIQDTDVVTVDEAAASSSSAS